MTEGIYYWTYRSHPHSNEDFMYDGILPYAPNSHLAHKLSEDLIETLEDEEQAIKHDLGVHMVMPINSLAAELYDVEDALDIDHDDIDMAMLKREVRKEITEEDILEVAERQERMERHEMGEDVEGVTDFDLDS